MISRNCVESPMALSDSFKRIIDPQQKEKKKERSAGLKPKNLDTPLGNFNKPSRTAGNTAGSKNKSESLAGKSPATRSPAVRKQTAGRGAPLPSPLQASPARVSTAANKSATLPSPLKDRRPSNSGTRTTLFSEKGHKTSVATESARDKRKIPTTRFREYYDKNQLPVRVFHGGNGGNRVKWIVDIRELDYSKFLPLFVDGLREKDNPYRLLAVQGTHDLLESGGEKVLAVLPTLIPPIRTALNTRDEEILVTVMKMIQQMLLCHEAIGLALVAFYRQILPVFNIFKDCHRKCNDDWSYTSRLRQCLGETIDETLAAMEQAGGDPAFISIKYSIPTYESCKGKVWCFNRNERFSSTAK
eukprot:Selendium_serpulae@DN5805_c0_g1_i10.p1